MSTVSRHNFSAGEISPAIQSKPDQVKFQTGLRTLRNGYVMSHGGACNRAGTQFVMEVKDSSLAVRLIPFTPNSTQTFVLEFGNLKARRIYHNSAYVLGGRQGQVLSTEANAKTITGITQGVQATVSSTSHGYSNGDEIFLRAIAGMTELNGRNVIVSDQTADTYKIKDRWGSYIDTSGFTAYVSGGASKAVLNDTHVYLTADLPDIRIAESQNNLVTVHPSYIPKKIAYSFVGANNPGSLAYSSITFGDGQIAAPTNLVVGNPHVGTTDITWYLTAIDDLTGIESAAVTYTLTNQTIPTTTNYFTFSATGVSGCSYYRFYRRTYNGVEGNVFGYLTTLTLDDLSSPNGVDTGQFTPDPSRRPPSQMSVLSSTDNFPACVGTLQQRYVFGNSNTDRERVWFSKTGVKISTGYCSMQRGFPLQDDDAFLIDMIGREFNDVRHIIESKLPAVLTASTEYVFEGDQSGSIIPLAPNKRAISNNGASRLAPIHIDNTALYVQERGQKVRDLFVEMEADGYRGTDLSIFSQHLVENYTIVDWAYQKTPHSVVWMVRSDGVVLSLTYIREQRIYGWARHDFDGGTVENVCCIPEGLEHAVYFVVKRTIDGRTTRYIERLNTRVVDDITDYVGMDSAVTRDGTNSTATTMTISGGTTWDYEELLTVTASSVVGINLDLDAGHTNASTGHGFSSADVGNEIHFYDSDGVVICRIEITEFVSTTVVKGHSAEDVPAAIRTTATATWGHAKTVVKGLWHLEGEAVSVFGDGYVEASPYNDQYDVLTVTDGQITMGEPYVKVHVGLPFISDIETIKVDTDQSETVSDKKAMANRVTVDFEKTRGVFIGVEAPSDDDDDPLEGLSEFRMRNQEGYNEVTELMTGTATENIQSNWNNKGRVFLRQIDPLPMTVFSIMPAGLFPFQKKGGT